MLSQMHAGFERSSERRLLGLLAVLCGLVMIGGITLTSRARESALSPSITLGDVSEAHIVEIRDLDGNAILSGEFRSRVDAFGNTEKDAALTDPLGRTVIGEIEVEIPAPGRDNRRTELEVDIISLPARQTFAIAIDDRIVGAFTSDDRGSVDLELQEGEIPPHGGEQ